jgi:GGDEF domain-containing protein
MSLRETDILSRISGDEFLLLLNPVQAESEVADYIDFMLQRLKAPFFIDQSEIFASTSIGVSLYPEHGQSYDTLRQNADMPCTASPTTARARRRSSIPAWSARPWRG